MLLLMLYGLLKVSSPLLESNKAVCSRQGRWKFPKKKDLFVFFGKFPGNPQRKKKLTKFLMLHPIAYSSPANKFTNDSNQPRPVQTWTATKLRKKTKNFSYFLGKVSAKTQLKKKTSKSLLKHHIILATGLQWINRTKVQSNQALASPSNY